MLILRIHVLAATDTPAKSRNRRRYLNDKIIFRYVVIAKTESPHREPIRT